jgi:hypothetical protein
MTSNFARTLHPGSIRFAVRHQCSAKATVLRKQPEVRNLTPALAESTREDRFDDAIIVLPAGTAWPQSFHSRACRRGVAQPGRAPGSGPGGRRFKSSLPDHSFQAVAANSTEYILGAMGANRPGECTDRRKFNVAHSQFGGASTRVRDS